MDREDALAVAAVMLAIASGALAWWASGIYDTEQTAQVYYYVLTGRSSAAAHVMAAKDAAASVAPHVTAAWIFLGAALAAGIAALAVKSGQAKLARGASV